MLTCYVYWRLKMKKVQFLSVVALLCVPLFVHAQAYRCKQTNGSSSFQDQPCQAGVTTSTIVLKPAPIDTIETQEQLKSPKKATVQNQSGLKQSVQEKEQNDERRRAEEETRMRNAPVLAYNKMQRCNHARQQLGVLKESRPVFRRDNDGGRNYVDDRDRGNEISAAERRVAAECQ
jgi:hypothetical protein